MCDGNYASPRPVLLRLVPPTIVAAIAQERIRIVRDIHIPAQDTLSIEKGSIADRLYHMDTAIVSPHMHLLEQVAALPCGMHDISPGGVCLTLPGTPRPEEMLHRVIRLHIPLPDLAAQYQSGTVHAVRARTLWGDSQCQNDCATLDAAHSLSQTPAAGV